MNTTPSRLTRAFARAKSEQRAALVLYLMAGDPDLETTGALLQLLDELGVDVVELGIPFSDPVADGPVIQDAGLRALQHDITLSRILDFVGSVRNGLSLPLVAMGYANPVFQLGLDAFPRRAAACGLDGVIIPDLPWEEGGELAAAAGEAGLDWIQLAAPTTSPERLRQLGERTRGFLYYVSRTGITGVQNDLSPTLLEEIHAVHQASAAPVAVGFGISTPEQAALVGQHADGVVIGSALVRIIAENPDRDTCLARVRAFVEPIQQALRQAAPAGQPAR